MFLPMALRQLLGLQMRARCRRAFTRFRSPRRLLFSAIAVLLGAVWMGQALLGVLYRPSADVDRLLIWIPLGLTSYAGWHLLKACVRPPLEPFEWTPTEQEMLGGAPLPRPDLIRYRFATILFPALLKSLFFAVVMIPDLHLFAAGWVGMFLALLAIDLVRMLGEIVAYGVSRAQFLWLRGCALALAIGLGLRLLIPVVSRAEVLADPQIFVILKGLWAELNTLASSATGTLCLAPASLFVRLVFAETVNVSLVAEVTVSVAVVMTLMIAVVRLDRLMWTIRLSRERRGFGALLQHGPSVSQGRHDSPQAWRQPPHGWGTISLAWRQFQGVRWYGPSVLAALLVPGVLSLLPMLGSDRPNFGALQMIGSLVFYTLVLLPAAFKFDFRRDLDRLTVLKSLPLSPWAIVMGQLAVPVLLCSVFQLSIVGFGMSFRPYDANVLLIGICIMVLANVMIFALENLVFLLYPYRLNQEGVDIFIRSIIVLTAKTLLFGVGLAVTLGWALVARTACGFGTAAGQHLFLAGMVISLLLCSVALVSCLVRVYIRFDPSQDVPALS